MKHEWRKQEKELYLPKKIEIISIPKQHFLLIEGAGNPNSEAFAKKIEALYSVSYGIRMGMKKGRFGEAFEYTVYPLEGIWTTEDGSKDEALNKESLVYCVMIRQPDGVTKEIVEEIKKEVFDKKKNSDINLIRFESYEDGLSLQTIHQGSFDTEVETFKKMDAFLADTPYEKDWLMDKFVHREIYLSDPRKVVAEKRKTVLRYKLKEK